MEMLFEKNPWGFITKPSVNGKAEDGQLDYRFPNMMVLHIPLPIGSMRLLFVSVPIDAQNVRVVIITMRNFLKLPMFDWLFNWANKRVAREDKPIVETSSPAEIPDPRLERSVRTDYPTLYFRRQYLDKIKDQI
jgi:hypothetical protein